ncbi:hypothetical protein KIPB_012929, partial [Kipferlia bialata]
ALREQVKTLRQSIASAHAVKDGLVLQRETKKATRPSSALSPITSAGESRLRNQLSTARTRLGLLDDRMTKERAASQRLDEEEQRLQ